MTECVISQWPGFPEDAVVRAIQLIGTGGGGAGTAITPYMFAPDGVTIDTGVVDATTYIQAAVDWGKHVDFVDGKFLVSSEIALHSNCHLYASGGAEIFSVTGQGTTYAPSIFVAFDKENISICDLKITGPRGGRSGSWTPVGTLDGVGACILLAGCAGVKVTGNYLRYGSDPATSNGVGCVYMSSCMNAIVALNDVGVCDNGIVLDQWYTKLTGKSALYQQGTTIACNVIHDCTGRGVVVEHMDNDNGGETVVLGNSIYNILNAGVQVRGGRGVTVISNPINMANINRSALISDNRNGLIGIEVVSGVAGVKLIGNTIINPRNYGIQVYNAQFTTVAHNNIRFDASIGANNVAPTIGILVQNSSGNSLIEVGIRDNDVMLGTLFGIKVSKAGDFSGSSRLVAIKGNTVNHVAGVGIYCDYPADVAIKGNEIRPQTTYSGSAGIDVRNSVNPDISGNTIYQCSNGLYLNSNQYVTSRNRMVACTNALQLINNTGGASFDHITACANAYAVSTYGTNAQMDATHAVIETTTNIKDVASDKVRIKTCGTAAPTSGFWGRGDIVENTAPAAIGDPAYWQCVTTGSPGTWGRVLLQ